MGEDTALRAVAFAMLRPAAVSGERAERGAYGGRSRLPCCEGAGQRGGQVFCRSEVSFEFGAPGRIRTCAHGSGGRCTIRSWPAQTCSGPGRPDIHRTRPNSTSTGDAGRALLLRHEETAARPRIATTACPAPTPCVEHGRDCNFCSLRQCCERLSSATGDRRTGAALVTDGGPSARTTARRAGHPPCRIRAAGSPNGRCHRQRAD